MRKSLFSLILLGSLTFSGCSTVMNNLPGVYTLDIQQGNRVSQDMINQLKPNMNKRQVLYIMGSPMLVDVFHKKRWDYLYSSQLGGEERVQQRVSLYFEGDILTGVQGDFKPDLNAKKVSKEMTVDVPKRDLDQSLWGKLVRLFGSDDSTSENAELVSEKEIQVEKIVESDDNAVITALEKEPEQTIEKVQDATEKVKSTVGSEKVSEKIQNTTEKTKITEDVTSP